MPQYYYESVPVCEMGHNVCNEDKCLLCWLFGGVNLSQTYSCLHPAMITLTIVEFKANQLIWKTCGC